MESTSVPVNPVKQGNMAKAFSSTIGQSQAQRISLVWHNINLSVMQKDPAASKPFQTKYKNKRILRNISGRAASGELLAIMGPTGCGKTSFMNVLAGRVSGIPSASAALTGEVFVNGTPRDDASFRKYTAYVLQDDRLYPHLTVYETLIMSAHFFLPDAVTDAQKEELVTAIIAELGLVKTRDTIIGDEKVRGVSGGERKRANIAVQLISDPAILFLDEPTSGLDSFQAQAVMEAMKNLTMNGRLVISVIHQPRSSIFDMFDQLLLLSEGRCIYLGPSKEASQHFSSNGYIMPRFFNPADYFLDVLSPDSRTKEFETAANLRILHLASIWRNKITGLDLRSTRNSEQLSSKFGSRNAMSAVRFFRNLRLLYWRAWTEISRDYTVIIFKCILSVFFSCIIGAMYNHINNDQASIYNREGLIFIIVLNQAFNNCLGVVNTFSKEKVIVNRERATGAYDTLSYFFAKFFAELPINLIPATVFGTIIYWIVDLNNNRFGYYILILLLEVLTAISLGLAVSAVAPNADVANGLAIPCVIIPLLFSGFYINLNSLPIVANWVPYASFMRWAFQALIINEFEYDTFDCSGGTTTQCFTTGEQVIESLYFDKISLRRCVLGLGCCLVIFLLAAIFFLEMSSLKFLDLGHTGGQQKGQTIEDDPPFDSARITASTKRITGVGNSVLPLGGEAASVPDEVNPMKVTKFVDEAENTVA